MKRNRLLLVLSLVVILSIIAVAFPATPVLAAAGSLYVSQYSGTVGTVVQISGTNYTANTNYTVTFRAKPFAGFFSTSITGKVNSSGKFQTSFTIPAYPRGEYEFDATTASAGGVAMDTTGGTLPTFYINPSISLSSASGIIGSQIKVSGNGFTSGSPVYIYFNNTPLFGTLASSNGSFSNIDITIPEAVGGSVHIIKVGDSPTNTINLPFTVNPQLFVTPNSVQPGGKVTISGNGFSASSSLTITLDNTAISANVSTNANGVIPSTAITIPAVSAGKHSLKVTDRNGLFDTVEVTTTNSLTIFPQSGAAGDPIALTGTGFGINKVIAVYFDGVPLSITPGVVTDSNGDFKATITIPETPAGTHVINVSDNVSAVTAQLTTKASAKPGKDSGKVDESIAVNGSGFSANADITIKYDNMALTTAKASANGSFASSIKLPAGTAGAHKVTVSDGINSVTFDIILQATAKIDKPKGNIGTQVTITGYAFNPGSPVTVKYDSITIPAGNADSTGQFSATFKVPASTSGNHEITVTDGVTNQTIPFVLEAAPPAVPKIVTPASETKASSPAKFEWEAVTSANGKVTYELKIAQNSGMNNPIIIKEGLANNSYELTEEETKLLKPAGKDKPYYWSVKAINAAGDASNDSTPVPFSVGFIMPTWVWYFIGVVGAILLFGAGFVLGRRMEARRF